MSLQYNPLMEYKSPRDNKRNIEMLFEYYDVISQPQDTDILGNLQIWIYGSDREKYPPHCHIRFADGSFGFEVSLLDWTVVSIKHSNAANSWDSIDRNIKKAFFTWLNRPSIEGENKTNKHYMFYSWNSTNRNNRLENWIDKKSALDPDLLRYVNHKPFIDSGELMGMVMEKLLPIYNGTDKTYKNFLHNLEPLQLLKELQIDIKISEDNKKLINIIKTAEKIAYDCNY